MARPSDNYRGVFMVEMAVKISGEICMVYSTDKPIEVTADKAQMRD